MDLEPRPEASGAPGDADSAEPTHAGESCQADGTENWETADLEDKFMQLKPPSSADHEQPASQEGRVPPKSKKEGRRGRRSPLPQRQTSSQVNAAIPAAAMVQTPVIVAANGGLVKDAEVDSFLREALQSPRDRLTILRLDQEIEKFLRNPDLKQYEFQPMSNSYMRLAAHKVAKHYGLITANITDSTPDGQSIRIIARKSGESQPHRVRLSEYAESVHVNRSVNANQPVVKLAIKQRPSTHGNSAEGGSGHGLVSKVGPMKSVEERKEEYQKARARIFSSSAGGSGSADSGRAPHEQTDRKYGPSSPASTSGAPMPQRTRPNGEGSKGANGRGEGGSRGKGKGPAIFRDREKDRRDPDYDRSYDRFNQRFDPGFGLNVAPYGIPGIYAPVMNYGSEFPQLGAPSPRGPPAMPIGIHPAAFSVPMDMRAVAPQPPHPAQIPGPFYGQPMATAFPAEMMAPYGQFHMAPAGPMPFYVQQPPPPQMGFPGPPMVSAPMFIAPEQYQLPPNQFDPRFLMHQQQQRRR